MIFSQVSLLHGRISSDKGLLFAADACRHSRNSLLERDYFILSGEDLWSRGMEVSFAGRRKGGVTMCPSRKTVEA